MAFFSDDSSLPHLQFEALAKGKGEGSRGGHIIGHTKSGKPIYAVKRGGKTFLSVEGGVTVPASTSSIYRPIRTSLLHAWGGKTAVAALPEGTPASHYDASEAHQAHAAFLARNGRFKMADRAVRAAHDHHQAMVLGNRGAYSVRHNVMQEVMGRTASGKVLELPVAGSYPVPSEDDSVIISKPDVARIARNTKEKFPHFTDQDHRSAAYFYSRPKYITESADNPNAKVFRDASRAHYIAATHRED